MTRKSIFLECSENLLVTYSWNILWIFDKYSSLRYNHCIGQISRYCRLLDCLCQVEVKVLCDNYVPQWWVEFDDELSWLFTRRFRVFSILFAENSQNLLKISVIPILLTLIYLEALNLIVNNQLNSSSNSTHHCGIILNYIVGYVNAKKCTYLGNLLASRFSPDSTVYLGWISPFMSTGQQFLFLSPMTNDFKRLEGEK